MHSTVNLTLILFLALAVAGLVFMVMSQGNNDASPPDSKIVRSSSVDFL